MVFLTLLFVFRLRLASNLGLEIFVNEGNLRKILSRISIRLTTLGLGLNSRKMKRYFIFHNFFMFSAKVA